MKPSKYVSLAFFLYIILSLFSCNPKEAQTSESGIRFDSIKIHHTPHYLNDPSKPSFNVRIDFIYPVAGLDAERIKAIQKIFVRNIPGEEGLSNLTPLEAANTLASRDSASFKDEGDEILKAMMEQEKHNEHEDDKEIDLALSVLSNIHLTLRNDILFNNNNIISCQWNRETYYGGAHCSRTYKFFNINLVTSTQLTEKDIFIDDYQSTLTRIIISKLMKQSNVKDASALEEEACYFSIEEITPNNNFSIGKDGLTFIYNEYEIACYAAGVIKVFIPYTELREILSSDSPLIPLSQ
ncbi:MAG: RsiV family protein [Tannerellaceae bacterium]|jgi:hypothetical protein|nr:RsiV family protein [Tannerellaceae bacterium]